MIRFPLLLSLALLAGSPAFAAPALRLSTTLTTPAGRTAAPHIANASRPVLKLDGNAKAGISALVLDKAVAMLGTSYQLGSNDAAAVDCSALVQHVFHSAGLDLPRTSNELLRTGTAVRRAQLRPGDLLIYRWSPRRLHVAVYLDDGHIIHASPSAGRVVITELNERWQRRLVAIRRLL